MLSYDPRWEDGIEIVDSRDHVSEIFQFIYDEFPDSEGNPKNELYFSDFSGIISKIPC